MELRIASHEWFGGRCNPYGGMGTDGDSPQIRAQKLEEGQYMDRLRRAGRKLLTSAEVHDDYGRPYSEIYFPMQSTTAYQLYARLRNNEREREQATTRSTPGSTASPRTGSAT